MNELDSLNMLLRLIGSSPVNSVVSRHPDAVNAITTLNRMRTEYQQVSWWFNTEYSVTMKPNNVHNIVVDTNVGVIIPYDNSVVKRGNKLYNVVTNTYTFSEAVTVHKIVRILEWQEMPVSMQLYCAYMAGSQYIRDELEDPQKQRQLEVDAQRAYIEVQKQHLNARQLNVFDHSTIRKARNGVRPYLRSNILFSGSPDS